VLSAVCATVPVRLALRVVGAGRLGAGVDGLLPALAVVVIYCRYYPLMVRSLNSSIKGNRAMLRLVPPDVVNKVPILHETVSALVKKML
jgi:hypothetical protein